MANWPSTLPDFNTPLSDKQNPIYIRSSVDNGPQKVRKRYTATPRTLQATIRIDGSQRSDLDYLYEHSVKFDRSDPKDDTTQTYRFLAPPEYQLIVGNEDPDKRQYNVTLSLEILP